MKRRTGKDSNENGLLYCKKCCHDKEPEEFGINQRTKEYCKHCIKCREKQKIYDMKKRKKFKDFDQKESSIDKIEQRRQRCREYYKNNKDQIIDQKRDTVIKKSYCK